MQWIEPLVCFTKEGLMTITERMDHSLAIFDIEFNGKGLSFKYSFVPIMYYLYLIALKFIGRA